MSLIKYCLLALLIVCLNDVSATSNDEIERLFETTIESSTTSGELGERKKQLIESLKDIFKKKIDEQLSKLIENMIEKLDAILSVLVISTLTTIYISIKEGILIVQRIMIYFETKHSTSKDQTYYKDNKSNHLNKLNRSVVNSVNEMPKQLIKDTKSVKKCSCTKGCKQESKCGCRSAGLTCTNLCHNGISCNNDHTDI
jgi:hypothetical protein